MTIYNKIDKFITNLFIEEQNARGILNGDIAPELELELDNVKSQLSNIIEKVLEYQESIPPSIIEIAASAGQYVINGIPLIFTLFQYENQKDDKYWLKIEMETTIDELFYGKEYYKTETILKQYNEHCYGSYDVEQLNRIVRNYTHDYADFEWSDEKESWCGNIF